jgi:hypothetical protein
MTGTPDDAVKPGALTVITTPGYPLHCARADTRVPFQVQESVRTPTLLGGV